MGFQCKVCSENAMDCVRCEITLADGTLVIAYVCDKCCQNHAEEELYRIVVRKILH